ncbi:MAG: aspartate aminotransferase family protein [Deltaproteobacteria bacterium]|nr:aspartate aminotransferase family protein [Candidatus Zymogenaceae bacterium]
MNFELTPKKTDKIETAHRTIVTDIPVPETLPLLEDLRAFEPLSMSGQPLVVWDRAEGFTVSDAYGNKWIDFSSGVLVANCGHLRPEMKAALIDQIESGMIHSYCFPNEPRAKLVRRLVELAPPGLDKVFLVTTGAEATENAIKLVRTHGMRTVGPEKNIIVTFEGAFHGRTLGSQLAGGIPALKDWIGKLDPTFVQVPFPDGYRFENTDFSVFTDSLKKQGVTKDRVCGVMMESYQGGIAGFYPDEYMHKLRAWCDDAGALLIDDEVQAGFGRSGRFFSIEHYKIVPDIICCGKGMSGGLPIAAVIGSSRFMDYYGPGEMTSTHSANPLTCRSALTSIDILEKEGLVENSRLLGEILHEKLRGLQNDHPDIIGRVNGRGLVAALLMVKPNTKEPFHELAFRTVEHSVQKGLMMYAPLGPGGGTVKMNPPLMITEEALKEGISVLAEAVAQARNDMNV